MSNIKIAWTPGIKHKTVDIFKKCLDLLIEYIDNATVNSNTSKNNIAHTTIHTNDVDSIHSSPQRRRRYSPFTPTTSTVFTLHTNYVDRIHPSHQRRQQYSPFTSTTSTIFTLYTNDVASIHPNDVDGIHPKHTNDVNNIHPSHQQR